MQSLRHRDQGTNCGRGCPARPTGSSDDGDAAAGAACPWARAGASSSVLTCPSKALSPSSSRWARATVLSCWVQRGSDRPGELGRERVKGHPGAKVGSEDRPLGGEERVDLGAGGQGTLTAEPRAVRKASTGPRGGGATHTYAPLPATPLFSPRAPDPLCTHRLRLCEGFLATGPGELETQPPPGGGDSPLPPGAPACLPQTPSPKDLLLVETPSPGSPAPPFLHDHRESQP